MIQFGTKAETLDSLYHNLTTAKVLPQIRFNVADWESDQLKCCEPLLSSDWLIKPLIVRSSGLAEDHASQSLAGHFDSVANVTGIEEIRSAITQVAASFEDKNGSNQIFIQPMLTNVICSGVAFSKDPNTGGPYFVISYDDVTGSTSSVTSGNTNNIKTVYIYKHRTVSNENPLIQKIVNLLNELETLFQTDSIDVEFAITDDQQLYLLQVRPLVVQNNNDVSRDELETALGHIQTKVAELSKPHPYLCGSRTVFGVMPDWNPAEIIGIRPRPLALSLYKEIITDNIWAYQRDNYGYKNLRSFPLLISFYGLPYIDVRVSFNSFIPADIDRDLSERLANYYIERLVHFPSFHDKVEFEIIYSCYTLDLNERLEELKKAGFDESDCNQLAVSLRRLTNRIIHNKNGLWRNDIAKISELENRRKDILNSSLDKVSKIYWLLEDCKRYGTLPFAGLARAGFIAVQLLKSLVHVNVITASEYEIFMSSLDTVSSRMTADLAELSPQGFLSKYGHLRPGTYDILSRRYDEAPELYFDWTTKTGLDSKKHEPFVLSLEQLKKIDTLLKEHQLEHDILGLFEFIKSAIEGREYAKFVFTKSLSDAMELFKEWAADYGFSPEDAAFADIDCIKQLYSTCTDAKALLAHRILEGKHRYRLTQQITLPPLITSPEDIWAFHLPQFEPNYVTLGMAEGHVAYVHDERSKIKDSILFIPSADPGYDWIFSHEIKGFVTMYGGVNSHMAIRAGELGIPAVIGVGETLYTKWSAAQYLQIDCLNKVVRILR